MASAGVTPARQTIFALISALERDARDALAQHLPSEYGAEAALGAELSVRTLERCEGSSGLVSDRPWPELLEYTDLGDVLALLNRHSDHLEDYESEIQLLSAGTPRLIGARNRLAHTRPLDEGDFPEILELTSRLSTAEGRWPEIQATHLQLREDPSFLLAIEIPAVAETHMHNLPTPDWDETGFLGRRALLKKVKRALRSAYPVISIVGEGGLGKTSLALRVAYDVLESEANTFDAIVWTSAKTTKLTTSEVQHVEDAISTSLGLLQDVATQLAGDRDTDDALNSIIEYLDEFNILLILDNLETVLDERLEEFFASIPMGSRILTTSRIGLGKFDVPIKLEPMDASEGARLIRALARTRGIEDLFSCPEDRLHEYVRRLNFNPGAMRWFVSVVSTGVRPEDALRDQGVFIDFCMTNIYGYLSDRAKGVLRVLLCVPGSLTQPEIAHFSDISVDQLQSALIELMRTNTVRRSTTRHGTVDESAYELNDLARQYLARHHPATSLEYEFAQRKRDDLESHGRALANEYKDPFNWTSLRVRTRSEIAVARKLQDVIQAIEVGELEAACDLAETVRDLAPEYYETHRLLAHAQAARGDVAGATQAFEAAIDCSGDQAAAHFHYGRYLSHDLGHLDEARRYLELAAVHSDRAIPVLIELAKIVLREGDLQAAYDLLSEIDISPHITQTEARDIMYIQVLYHAANIRYSFSVGALEDGLNFLDSLVAILASTSPNLIPAEAREELAHFDRIKSDTVGWMPKEAFSQWLEGVRELRRLSSPRREDDEAEMIATSAMGSVKNILDGFGFIAGADGNDYFFHQKHLKTVRDIQTLRPGMKVEFSATKSFRGYRAIDVVVAAQAPQSD